MSELILTNDHRYLLDGKRIDGLTDTIEEAGLIRNANEWYLQRGTAIHRATEFWDKATLDESTVDPQIQGYLESWKRFRKDQNYTPIKIEYSIYHPELIVGTTIDRLPGPLDLKSGSPEPWHILQIAFQVVTIKIHNGLELIKTPMDIYLDPDGGLPKLEIYSPSELREAFGVYASMLYFLRWKRGKYGNSRNERLD